MKQFFGLKTYQKQKSQTNDRKKLIVACVTKNSLKRREAGGKKEAEEREREIKRGNFLGLRAEAARRYSIFKSC